ncbi:MAG: hypothetical protein KAS07_04285 [Candidatus Pacebacteria bacterium]|nr:hypothetical protein [Candidatus Paceibacterota bacterium]
MNKENILLIIAFVIFLIFGVFVYYISSGGDNIDQPDFNPQEERLEEQVEEKVQEKLDTDAMDEEETETSFDALQDEEEEEKSEKVSKLVPALDSEKNKDEIQNLLNKQCEALSNKDLELLVSTMDPSDVDAFWEYEQSVEILLSMMDSVVVCQYDVQDIQFDESGESLFAETSERGDLQILLIGGSTKIIEDPNVLRVGMYTKVGEEWKQIINVENQ